MNDRNVVDLGAAGFHVLQKIMIDFCEILGDRRGAEEPLEAALGETGRDRLAVQIGDAVFFSDRAGGQRDVGLIGAAQRNHLLLGDQAQRLVLAGGRAALVVGENHFHLGAAETGQTGPLGHRQVA